MGNIQCGTISTFESPFDSDGNATKARVIPDQRKGVLTRPLVIPCTLRGDALKKGTRVIFVEFSHRTGAIIMRADGEDSSE